MTFKPLISLSAYCLLFFAILTPLRSEDLVPGEKARIEALIAHLETLAGAVFIRNGSEYDSKTAAKFLRGKWQANGKEIKSAADFIAKAATGSSTSGKPYLIRLKDGSEMPCAGYLSRQLSKLETAGPIAPEPDEPGKSPPPRR